MIITRRDEIVRLFGVARQFDFRFGRSREHRSHRHCSEASAFPSSFLAFRVTPAPLEPLPDGLFQSGQVNVCDAFSRLSHDVMMCVQVRAQTETL